MIFLEKLAWKDKKSKVINTKTPKASSTIFKWACLLLA